MSLQTLKKKSSVSVSTNGSFSLNGGPRTLSYIGKTSKNSSIGTPMKGVVPVNSSGDNKSVIFKFPVLKAALGQTKNIQTSTKTTNGMIATKYKWIEHSQYPNHWVQPANNPSASDYITKKRLQIVQATECSNNGPMASSFDLSCSTGCVSVVKRQTSDYSIRRQLVNNNYVPANRKKCDYLTRIQSSNIIVKEKDKPFPFYTTNPGQCSSIPILTAPEWYITQ